MLQPESGVLYYTLVVMYVARKLPTEGTGLAIMFIFRAQAIVVKMYIKQV